MAERTRDTDLTANVSAGVVLDLLDVADAIEEELSYKFTDYQRRKHFPKTAAALRRLECTLDRAVIPVAASKHNGQGGMSDV